MGVISNASAVHGISAKGTPSKTKISGSITIGTTQVSTSLTGADAAYSFTVLSTGTSDVASLVVRSGVCSQSTDTPTITDGDGKDFEGATITTLATASAIMIKADEVGTGTVVVTSSLSGAAAATLLGDGQIVQTIYPVPITVTAETITITFTEAAQQVTVTVIGSTT